MLLEEEEAEEREERRIRRHGYRREGKVWRKGGEQDEGRSLGREMRERGQGGEERARGRQRAESVPSSWQLSTSSNLIKQVNTWQLNMSIIHIHSILS